MKRRGLFMLPLAVPAIVAASMHSKPVSAAPSEGEMAAALKLIDAYAERTFGHVRDGVKRAFQTYLLNEDGREIRYKNPEIGPMTYMSPRIYGAVSRVHELFGMDGENRSGVPDVLAKAVIAWLDSTLHGSRMAGNEDSVLCWRRRPEFSLVGPDFEMAKPGGPLRITARAHTWIGQEYRPFERDFDTTDLRRKYDERVAAARAYIRKPYGT